MSPFTFQVIILGACVGSFLNVVIYRLPKRKSFVSTRSHCPKCKTKLNAFDLIPVISWILLRGKCRYCTYDISKRYPLIELITSILFLLSINSRGWIDNFSPNLFVVVSGWILVSYLITLSFIDIDNMILPNSITYSGSFIGLVIIFYYDFFINNSPNKIFLEHVLAYLLAYFGFLCFSYIVKLLIKKPALGGGDAKLFAMSGVWLGLEGLEVAITLSFLVSAVFVAFGFVLRLIKRGEYIPFGPFICFSIFLVWYFGPQFWFAVLGDMFWWKYL